MSSPPNDFKKVKAFWISLEETKPVSCAYFSKRKLISDATPNAKAENAKSQTKALNVNLDEESFIDTNTSREINTEIELENQCQIPEFIIIDADSSPSEDSVRPELIQIPCNETDSQSIVLEASIDKNLISPESDDEFDQTFSDNESIIRTFTSKYSSKKQFLYPDNIINDSDSYVTDVSNDDDDAYSSLSNYGPCAIKNESNPSITTNIKTSSEVSYFDDDDWLFHKNHIFVLSFAGKPIFSLHGHGYESQMVSLFALIHCLVSVVEGQQDRISSIEAEGIKFVFLVQKSLYLVATSRDNMSVYHLKLKLREVYNRIGFLLTFKNVERIFEQSPGYDLRRELNGNYKLIAHQFVANTEVSNNVFTLFTNTIRILQLPPIVRNTIRRTIQRKCSKISNLAFAVVIVDHQLVALVRLKNHPIYPADIRLIFNLMECSERIFNNYKLSVLPICLPDFSKDCYLHAYIKGISEECEAFLILFSYDQNISEDITTAHKEITKSLHKNTYHGRSITKLIQNVSKQGNGFDLEYIEAPGLRHFLYIPKSTNHQLLCSKIIPPYTCLSEFRRLESIYHDLHHRIHNKSRPLKLIFEVKEKEVALAIETDTTEIYAVFDPLVNTVEVANYYIDELAKSIKWDERAYFIKKYPNF